MSYLTSNPFFVIPAVVVFVMAVGAAFWLWLRSRRANKTAPAGGGAP
ncbi:MAG: hypothetical protein JWP63_2707, partial [Candidatus Solibacter sp.]|nr:hypothetical protein [Candidatus Solibacter sp.]